MKKKSFISLVIAGLLALPLSYTANAEETTSTTKHNTPKSYLSQQLPSSITIHNSIKQVKKFTSSSFNTFKTLQKNDDDILLEKEPNNDFKTTNTLIQGKGMVGQIIPDNDVDYYKINIPSNGIIFIAGTAGNSKNMQLQFDVIQKDNVKNNNLVFLDSENEDGVVVKAYHVKKAGTYYVKAYDKDQKNKNKTEDIYALSYELYVPSKPVVNKVGNNDKVVTGKADPDTKIVVKAGSKQLGSAISHKSKGTFSVNIKTQKAGTTLSIHAEDPYGNKSKTTTIKVKDVIPPAKPTVNKVDNNDKIVKGKAEANSTVTVKAGKKVLGKAKASSKGAFSVKIAVQKANTKLSITASDSSGNVSKATTITVKDVIPPAKPTINRVDSNDKIVKGKAEANSTVTVKVGKKTLGTAKANSKGNYTVKIKAQKKGTVLTVTAKDQAGNVSPKATRKVVKP